MNDAEQDQVREQPAPEVARLLELFVAAGAAPLHELGVAGARAVTSDSARSLQGPKVEVASVVDLTVPGPAGRIGVRVYHPAPGESLPLLVYVHGGGWVTGDLDVVDGPCRRLAVGSHCVVASIDYRRSPESPFPGPLDDVYAATRWLVSHSDELGATSEAPALVGDSAGGTLVAAAALAARDRGDLTIGSVTLLYPPLAPVGDSAFASYRTNSENPVLSAETMAWFWDQYLPMGSTEALAYPMLADSLAGLPPMLVVTAGLDVLRDEGRAFARRAMGAGVDTTLLDLPGLNHGFFWMDRFLPQAGTLVQQIVEHVRSQVSGEDGGKA